jgi:hypothetical protein
MSQLVASAAFFFSILMLTGCAGDEQQPVSETSAEASQEIQEVPHLLKENFRTFRMDDAGIPLSLVALLGPPPFGANWALAREVHNGTWAVPARGHICLVQQQQPEGSASVACTQTRRALTNGILAASLKDPSMSGPGPRREIIGLTPDGTQRARLITPGYRTVTVPVNSGVYMHRDNIPASPLTATLVRE